MKHLFTLWLCVFSWFGIYAQAQDIHSRPVQVERSHDFDALHYSADFSFNTTEGELFGKVEATVRALKNDFSTCLLDAGKNITVKSVVDEEGNPLDFNHEDTKLTVYLNEQYKYDDTIKFTTEYVAVNPEDDQLIFYEASEQYPSMIWGPNFPNRVRNWMPCYDFPNDKAMHDMIIHAPEGYKAVSNGKLVSVQEDKNPGESVWHWKQSYPHSTYLFVLAVAPYVVFEDSLGKLPVNHWVFPQDSASAIPAFDRTPEIIQFFNELYNYEYPWEKCDQVMVPPMGGAAESTTATLYSNGLINNLDEKGLKDYNFDRIIAHEVAHHWWGDLITLRTWSQTWLNESFGTYSDHIWTTMTRGVEEGAIDLEIKKNAYLNEAKTKYIRPIIFDRYELAYPGQNFDRHTYQKGALMLHLLRSIIGDDLFFKTLSYFLHTYEFQPVDEHDFIKAIKEVTGQNMEWFFDQFFHKPGHPVFEVTKSWSTANKTLTLKISQVQDTAYGVPFAYKIPVSIGIYNDGRKELKEIWLSKRNETVEFKLEEQPGLVKFDDENRLLKEITYDLSTEEMLFKLKYDDVIGRAEAASILGKPELSDRVRSELVARAQSDPSWYVRKAALEGLADSEYSGASSLAKQMVTDEHQQVRAAAVRILGNTNNKKWTGLLKKRFNIDDSYMVQAECIRSLGKCGTTRDIGFIKNARDITSTRNVIGKAADWSIKNLKK